jgi:imidazolonepropionase-like amidohydrolase
MSLIRNLFLSSAFALTVACPASWAEEAPTTFAITNARIFDGANVISKGTVLVQDGKITAVGRTVVVPEGMAVINAGNGTLLPGLIDSHTHVFGNALQRALVFGVTTELDMFTAPELVRQMHEEQARPGGAPGRADLFSAGNMATAPGGHGTQFGVSVPTITRPEEAQAWVDARIAEGSDYIKIALENGSAYGQKTPTLDRATTTALIAAAHERGKLAVVHVSTAEDARAALEAGADGLIHLFTDRAPDAGFAKLAAEKKAFVIPTLVVLSSTNGVAGGRPLVDDLRLRAYLSPDETVSLQRAFPVTTAGGMPVAFSTIRALKEAGVPILAGSDAPNPGTAHGVAIHRELEMLVEAGLTPTEALAAATSVPARAFRLEDRGRIAPGLRADLVLVAGDPTKDVTSTRDIVRIWKGGVPVERPILAQPASAGSAAPAPPLPAGGRISDFEDGTMSSSFGSWADSTDALRGGASVVKRSVVEGGAESGRAMEVSGEIRPGSPYPWSGAIFMPGAQPMAPADLSGARELVFSARGDGKTYQVLVFATSLGAMPAIRPFVAGPEWQRHTIPLTDFAGADPKGIMGIFFGSTTQTGAFSFRIDEVRLTPSPTSDQTNP